MKYFSYKNPFFGISSISRLRAIKKPSQTGIGSMRTSVPYETKNPLFGIIAKRGRLCPFFKVSKKIRLGRIYGLPDYIARRLFKYKTLQTFCQALFYQQEIVTLASNRKPQNQAVHILPAEIKFLLILRR
jgi:hypothetical protein